MCVQTVARLEEASGWSIVGHEQGFERTKTILLVEDEPFVREVTGEVLRAAGYRVLTAKNAKEGVSLYEAQSGEVELLLTDIILPGETGRVLAGRLRREDPTLKVLFVSGYSEQMVVSETMQEECRETVFQRSAAANREGIIGVRGDAEGDGRTTYARLR